MTVVNQQRGCEPRRAWLNSATAMLAKRIIPCLDVKAGRVVKGVKFKGGKRRL